MQYKLHIIILDYDWLKDNGKKSEIVLCDFSFLETSQVSGN